MLSQLADIYTTELPPYLPASEAATEKFQILGRICEVLMNDETRRMYDEHGEVDEADGSCLSQANIDSWYELELKAMD